MKIRRPGKRVCFTGETYGYLHIGDEQDYYDDDGNEHREYRCYCSACGNNVIMPHKALMMARWHFKAENKTPSCGCLKYSGFEKHKKESDVDLTGQRFENLVVEGFEKVIETGKDKKKRRLWKCKCDCGQTTYATTGDLTSGNTKSCGCIISVGQKRVAEIQRANNVNYIQEYTFDDLLTSKGNNLRFDFAIVNNDDLICLIEYQGEQHYVKSDIWFGRQQRLITDKMKKDYCKEHHIPQFEIAYNENIEEKLNSILQFVHDNTVPSSDTEKV